MSSHFVDLNSGNYINIFNCTTVYFFAECETVETWSGQDTSFNFHWTSTEIYPTVLWSIGCYQISYYLWCNLSLSLFYFWFLGLMQLLVLTSLSYAEARHWCSKYHSSWRWDSIHNIFSYKCILIPICYHNIWLISYDNVKVVYNKFDLFICNLKQEEQPLFNFKPFWNL